MWALISSVWPQPPAGRQFCTAKPAIILFMDKTEKEALIDAVKDVVRLVPRGRATSYGAIARAAGYPTLSRMVGRIMGGMSDAGVPAHRVVNSSGVLSGRAAFGAPGRMRELLESEGVEVENDRIKEWRRVFWNPMEEIKL